MSGSFITRRLLAGFRARGDLRKEIYIPRKGNERLGRRSYIDRYHWVDFGTRGVGFGWVEREREGKGKERMGFGTLPFSVWILEIFLGMDGWMDGNLPILFYFSLLGRTLFGVLSPTCFGTILFFFLSFWHSFAYIFISIFWFFHLGVDQLQKFLKLKCF